MICSETRATVETPGGGGGGATGPDISTLLGTKIPGGAGGGGGGGKGGTEDVESNHSSSNGPSPGVGEEVESYPLQTRLVSQEEGRYSH